MAERSSAQNIQTYKSIQKEAADIVQSVYDADGAAVDCSAATDITMWGMEELGSGTYQFTKLNASFSVGGASNNELTCNLTDSDTDFEGVIWVITKINFSGTRKLKTIFKLDNVRSPE